MIAISPPPGAPDMFVMSIPATLPCNKLAMFDEGIPFNSSALITDTEPVAFLLVVVP